MKKTQAIKELEEIALLPYNWDGDGAKKPRVSSIANAKKFLNKIKYYPTDIYLQETGHIIFKWKEKDFRLLLRFKTADMIVDAVLEIKKTITYYNKQNYNQFINLIQEHYNGRK